MGIKSPLCLGEQLPRCCKWGKSGHEINGSYPHGEIMIFFYNSWIRHKKMNKRTKKKKNTKKHKPISLSTYFRSPKRLKYSLFICQVESSLEKTLSNVACISGRNSSKDSGNDGALKMLAKQHKAGQGHPHHWPPRVVTARFHLTGKAQTNM